MTRRQAAPPYQHKVKDFLPEYGAWYQMIRRCTDPKCPSYCDYGARGVEVTPTWLGPTGFDQFMRDLGKRPSVGHSLDRKDVNLGYYAENCRWATRVEQASNTRRTRLVTLRGETKTFKEWATHYGLSDALVHTRINKLGWDLERAFMTPSAGTDGAKARYPEQSALNGAIQRCHNPRDPQYVEYGARGIAVCDAWRGRGALKAFKASVGPHPGAGYSLDRIDVNKGYEPGNCRWATRETQVNNRRVTKLLTYEGKTQTYAQWSRETGVDEQVIRCRLARGWSVARTLTRTQLQIDRAAKRAATLVASQPASAGCVITRRAS